MLEFDVEERPVPGRHEHTWVAIQRGSGAVVPLPSDGNGARLGSYPEIAEYLASSGGPGLRLSYSRLRGDTLDIAEDGRATWTFRSAGREVIVHDIPRLVASMSMSTSTVLPADDASAPDDEAA